MTDREIQDTPTDRAAVLLMQEASGLVIYGGRDAGLLGAAWTATAVRLAAMDDDAFSRVLDYIDKGRRTTPPEVMARADDLAAHLLEWRQDRAT